MSRYCREHGFIICEYYIDDGYSGKNFDRPDFKRMISDIEDGKINCVVTKDLSRLGRNYLETGGYTEIYFPEHGVRYIAVTDGVDTLNGSTMDITPFKNLLNDMFVKDISKKVKSALLTRQKQGKFIGNKAPYGYKKDPLDKNHLIIDERYAPIVREIYELAKSGKGISLIRKELVRRKIPRPGAVACESTHSFDRFIDDTNYFQWANDSVRDILQNPVYAGHIRGQYRPQISMKSNKRKSRNCSETFIVENCHEPIIEQDDWELVQRLIKSRRHDVTSEKYDNIFSNLIKCADCGYALTPARASRKKRTEIIDCYGYECNKYRMYGKESCSHHWLEARDLYEAILADIKRIANAAIKNDKKMLENISRKLRKNETDKSKQDEKDLRKFNRRLAELDKLFAKLYEDNASGKVSGRNYANLSAVYEKEQIEIEEKINALNAAIKTNKENETNAENFVETIKNYADITELNAAILNTLIDKIVVHEAEIIDGERVQKLDVYYKFVGILD